MLKLLQEVRGFAQFANRPPEPRPTGPLLLQFRGPRQRRSSARERRLIRIDYRELPDIPEPVKITYLRQDGQA